MSSYETNNYGAVFRSLILAKEPLMVVECGVLDGYSTSNIAHALRFNRTNKGIVSAFYAYDLFDEYEYNHGDYEDVLEKLQNLDLSSDCTLVKAEAFNVHDFHDDKSIDFLHFDISNDGDVLLRMLDTWGKKMHRDGIIAFEGGSKERDEGWIKKYQKRPIRPELIHNPTVYKNWHIQIFNAFPSLTLMWRKL
jgi:predicted O-methyltransferase YrrM